MGYGRKMQAQIRERSMQSKEKRTGARVGITYKGLLSDAVIVQEARREEQKKGGEILYLRLTEKLERMARLAIKLYHIDTEDFYNDIYNMAAAKKRAIRSLRHIA